MTDITELAQSWKTAAHKAKQANDLYLEGKITLSECVVETKDYLDYSDNPNNFLALVEVLEKAQQRIAELDIKNCELDSLTQRWAVERAENADRIAELESRTVTVKLPEPPGPMSVGARTVYFGIVADVVSAFQYGLTAAGIKVEVE
ncbi:hypothetical protein H5833_00205 [Klebsiella pneumoniae]|uniref:hypothetical protein n=1 Tax=Klebsiella pneumoniae complex TaxID=3390273 RepID=UPI000802901B|nr:hypothetical protein [Klebsiella pneumoniae]HCM7542642.1 hypothetical protein [Klebsiella quasipneumoniae subsp. similipneumoniae]EKZ9797306.1 hypothetical protein [Klebsiella pneumoniae]MCB3446343.1 hypothetical protein [Klebsiella pneumoniae]MCP5828868.1 hypothetical protein [Klebsiella pneumoniae]MCP5867297.1 hypothetical protein [Klebsiella pneumoniae]